MPSEKFVASRWTGCEHRLDWLLRQVTYAGLQAQHHDDIGVLQSGAHVAKHVDSHPFDANRQQGGGADHLDYTRRDNRRVASIKR